MSPSPRGPGAALACVILLSALAAGGCATSEKRDPYIQYRALQQAATPVAQDDRQALQLADITALQSGKAVATEITTELPRLQADGALSAYRVFSFRANSHQRYTVELRSLCDCWGVDKFMLYPVARILDNHGNTLYDNPASIYLRNPDWHYPVNIQMTWETDITDSGRYYFLVYAWNENMGTAYATYEELDFLASKVQKIPLAQAYFDILGRLRKPSAVRHDPTKHPLFSSPTGKIVVTLTTDEQVSGD